MRVLTEEEKEVVRNLFVDKGCGIEILSLVDDDENIKQVCQLIMQLTGRCAPDFFSCPNPEYCTDNRRALHKYDCEQKIINLKEDLVKATASGKCTYSIENDISKLEEKVKDPDDFHLSYELDCEVFAHLGADKYNSLWKYQVDALKEELSEKWLAEKKQKNQSKIEV